MELSPKYSRLFGDMDARNQGEVSTRTVPNTGIKMGEF